MRTFRPVEDRNLWTENHTSFFKNDVGDILHARFVAVNPEVLSDVSIIDERDNTTYSDNGELGLLCSPDRVIIISNSITRSMMFDIEMHTYWKVCTETSSLSLSTNVTIVAIL